MIKANAHKYSVSVIRRVLQVNRSTYYYETKQKTDDSNLISEIAEIVRVSRNYYISRKIKRRGWTRGNKYPDARLDKAGRGGFQLHKGTCKESKIENVLNRQFQGRKSKNVVVSDLSYVRVGKQWNYICMFVDLFNREMIGYSTGEKTEEFVKEAFQVVGRSLEDMRLFHTDHGNEFKNQTMEKLLEGFDMECSLSYKGCSYDNVVAEVTFKIIKTEFVWNEIFANWKGLK